jgi:hypothetical protein
MKRHEQHTGVRRWAGDDLIELQSEVFKVLDAFFAQYGNIIISGCEVTGEIINPGVVGLYGFDSENNKIFKVVPFAGRNGGNTFPVYLKLASETIRREYGDGQIKPVAQNYFAALSDAVPDDENYIIINRTGNKHFIPQAVKETVDSMDFLRRNYVLQLNDLYIKYPNGGRTGDCVLVMQATEAGAGWAYWDDAELKWKLMTGYSAPPPPPDSGNSFSNGFSSGFASMEAEPFVSIDIPAGGILFVPPDGEAQPVEINSNTEWNVDINN